MTSRTTAPQTETGSPSGVVDPIKAVPVRKYGQWAIAAIVALYAAQLIVSVARNETLEYGVVWRYLFHEQVLKGILVTFELTFAAGILGTLIGTLVAVAKLSGNPILRAVSGFYTWFFRGVPLLSLVLIMGNFAILFSHLSISLPFTDVDFLRVDTNSVLTIFVAAWIALSLHEGAYMGEVIRGGLVGVPQGQREAAQSLGMSDGLVMRRVILPQSLRTVVPPMSNRFIILLKESSLVSVIAGGELMNAVTDLSTSNYRVIEMLMVATLWYLFFVSLLTFGQRVLERRLSRGYSR